jgi:hypothetical protein
MDTLGLIIVTEHRTERGGGPSLLPQPRRHRCMFLQGRERRESEDGSHVSIAQPDLRRELRLDMQKRTFTVRPMLEQATAEERQRWERMTARYHSPDPTEKGAKSAFEIFLHVEKTEEHASFFGFQTRRCVTRRTDVYLEAGKSREEITDGWYLDIEHPALPKHPRAPGIGVMYAGNQRPVIHRSGEKHYPGIPVQAVTTTREMYATPGGSGQAVRRQITEVVRLDECALDPSLFEVPSGFRERSLFPSRWSQYARQFQLLPHRMRAV